MTIAIRLALPADAPMLPAVERAAAQSFAAVPGLEYLASSPVIAADQHMDFLLKQHEWVAVDAQDRPLGFLCGQDCDEDWHIIELSVHQIAQGRGLGRQLIGTAADWARSRGYGGLTLTTFTQVPWNAPFYARLGFEQLASERCSDFLQRQLAAEHQHGLRNRCAMRLDLQGVS
ncbi:GNAT family N-acetyltransferase [Pseudomonas sp. JQ170]|uniref:GNAT family N-acetyltransferase n=1 Tax=unclassified Pseudomonas TaxID=196821 RepID=UPI00264FBFCA|nr:MULTISPECIES: GNAT family N-acetyltransferase [unclassified Pseudomonas]MDN7139930.1 GNAT family N-acetyltransferase [Pseudomonas sp. JQ170]WRO73620.1 GNAT family N-acetyltransferase [Pseudomonas sp. 170C]